ncbi:MAG: MFS transporter [Candidatus Hydrogenedentes bacterium]|nr:MFS transporter [Candidatus Hydrogenedentota bacterium]
MENTPTKVYGYRWIVLLVFAVLNAVIEIHWVALAPITTEAAQYYAVTPLSIGFLSMLFMLVYLAVSIPASYVIDTYGIRVGVGAGAALIGIFGLLKGVYAANYAMVSVCQFGLAVAQPFILNAYTAISAKWFPISQRATATGLAALSQYIGIILAMAATPLLAHAWGIDGMLKTYGVISVVGAVLFLVFAKEAPPTPPSPPGQEERFLVIAGLKHMFKQKQVVLLLLMFLIGLGIFNAVTTWIEQILSPRGLDSTQAGAVGALMMIGGVLGASILPPISDKIRRRIPFLITATAFTIPGLTGLAFATNFAVLLASSFVLGFFIMSAGPIGFQYGAELSYPAPESTSQGLLLLAGQISGVAFIYGMDAFRSAGGSMTPFMIFFIAITALNVILCTRLNESEMIKKAQ